ncbi:MAG: DUF3553 domain-containing protein [Phycisphaeraceae bacterium]|nr:DUF3553 domain-containing protein [Phycisphaeraceae bacterium]
MPIAALKQGDQIRHPKRPEWGIGVVTRIELISREGQSDQRIWVRFPSVGVKTLLASVAAPELVGDAADAAGQFHVQPTLVDLEALREGGWLGEIAKNKPEDAMRSLPPRATDPFLSTGRRLENTLSLYRFSGQGRSLIEWAIAQSGLDDPLSRFSRHELEEFHKRWRFDLDAHLGRLLGEMRREPQTVQAALSRAPAAAVSAVKRIQQMRG